MKTVADTLGVSRSNLVERLKGALVQRSRLGRMPIFDEAVYAVVDLRRTDFGRAQSSMRLRMAQPMATSVC